MISILDAPAEYARLKRFQWDCRQPGCDGRPHQWMPYPHARAAQIVGDEHITMFCTGRGYGKTRSGAEWAKRRLLHNPDHVLNIVVPTFAVGRDVCIEGESGLKAVMPPEYVKTWNRSIGEFVLHNGSRAKIFGGNTQADAEAVRGSNSSSCWFEELGQVRYFQTAYDMAMLANRTAGVRPQVCITTTPKPTALIKKLLKNPAVRVVTGSTFDNAANLAPEFVATMLETYQGTRLGRQELDGLLLDDVIGALFQRDWFKPGELTTEDMTRLLVAIDPAGSHKATSDMTGIIVIGEKDGTLYVFEDLSGRYSPNEWASVAIAAYDRVQADLIVAETNFGAEMVMNTLRTQASHPRFREVHATRGKAIRAEGVISLYEQGRVLHCPSVPGGLTALEDQMCSWVPPNQPNDDEGNPVQPSGWSPDRLDALVWGVHELALKAKPPRARMRYET